ncbi:MAG TPA: OsmC family protein [Ornithinibacter sp.]|jgi:putative redox protein|nr:OsmC family protein [Ornithinibacter sp.]
MAQQHEQQTGGTGPGHRSISMGRSGSGTYLVTNARGGTISIGSGESDDFTPVELLLTAIAGCSAVDVDFITSRLAEPTDFTVTAGGEKLRDELGNHMGEIEVSFRVRFPEGDDGDRARERLPRAIAQSHDRLCTVSRSVQLGTPIHMRED